MNVFTDKVAIVTGGGSGIGRELCRELAGQGAFVVLADINGPAAQKVAAEITEAGGRARSAKLDVTDRAAVKQLVQETVAEFGQLDYMFNNVGLGVAGEVRDYAPRDWQEVIETNIYGTIHGIDAAYPVMIKQGFGHIVNTSSIAGLIPFPLETSYCAAKHAVVGLSYALAAEAKDLGIKVSVVCPGIIKTPIWQTNRTVNLDRDKALATLPIKMASAKRCAREILKGVEKNKTIIVITSTAKYMWYMHRLSPGLMLWMQSRQMRKFRQARLTD